ncbi:ABC transporter ATP-binding protein [Clostridium sp. 19966]|uniref:ABC transporter ATP-binding protein n=1 Tax=Clostridium sp. 19966 TaxID=2768166 RepID=UPI0028DE840F|nr:ABC transporter ATP-binding protein [Clostridium sp. 19966]MDT8719434.1 ABC transporter ATP-binding protein [Clostridium sp. 19966]
MLILEAKNLYKTYGSEGNMVVALLKTNFKVEKGEFVAIVGPSGSGKSTLLQLLAGLDTPTGGEVYIDEKNIYGLSEKKLSIFRRRNIGFIFQFFNLVPVLTVDENIRLPLIMDHKKADKDFLEEIIESLNLKERRYHYPSQLSGGQQQRTAIARALISKPSIIFADEPTGNLDSKNSKEVLELMKKSIKKYGQTLIMITHDSNVAAHADRIVTIEDGALREASLYE